MKNLIIVLCSVILSSQLAIADEVSCDAKAAANKLTGEAKYKFVKKCEANADAARKDCEAMAAGKRLTGEAKNNFMKKCVIASAN